MKPAYESLSLVDSAQVFENEAHFNIDGLMLYGGICEVTVVMKPETDGKEITVACDAAYLSFEMQGANIDRNTINSQTQFNEKHILNVESKKTLDETVSFTVPKYVSDFNLTLKCEGNFTIEKLTVHTKPCKSADYCKMVENSLRAKGNNARIKAVIDKAKAGEDVTLAYIGGSITEGFAASETDNSDCYAETSYEMFKKAFGKGDGSNVRFVNAGMSGTPSSLGIIRYERDVTAQLRHGTVPDILFIDYAVNDGEDDAETYEAVIRNALSQGSAVVLIFVLYAGGSNHEEKYVKIGDLYNLYMVSPQQGQRIGCEDKKAFDDWFYWLENGNYGHPDVGGHRYMADCIMNMFLTADSEDVAEDNIIDVFDITPANERADSFVGMKTLAADTDISKDVSVVFLNPGGFNGSDDAQPTLQYIKDGIENMKWFPDDFAHTSSTGNESFIAKIRCNTLMIAYKQAGRDFGTAEVYVDGEYVTALNNSNGGWNNACIEKIIVSKYVKEHEIEIKMADADKEKPFTIYAIGHTDTGK